jgi:ribosomal protein L34E
LSRLQDAERAAGEVVQTKRCRASPLDALVIRVRWAYEHALFEGKTTVDNGYGGWLCRDTTSQRIKDTARSQFPNTFLIYTYDQTALDHLKFQEVLNATG